MQTITPYLYYEDVAGALKWLAKAFGFKKFGPQMKEPGGKTNHAAMKLKDGVVMMGYPGPKYKNPKRLGHETQCLYIEVKDVDAHFERAKRAGAVIVAPMADQHYGARRYGAADPEGHHWYFAQHIPKTAGRGKSRR
jgi:PhnB protein